MRDKLKITFISIYFIAILLGIILCGFYIN